MHRFLTSLAIALLLAAADLAAGCGGGASGLATTTVEDPDSPGIRNDNPMARPISVAWTSARAKRCGFYFDAAKLRTSYMAYEKGQGAAGDKLAQIEKSYETTYKVISDKIAGDAGYCSEKKSVQIKDDLQRYLAGDYTPNLPQPKLVQACGLLGCPAAVSDQPFNSKGFWEKTDRETVQRR